MDASETVEAIDALDRARSRISFLTDAFSLRGATFEGRARDGVAFILKDVQADLNEAEALLRAGLSEADSE